MQDDCLLSKKFEARLFKKTTRNATSGDFGDFFSPIYPKRNEIKNIYSSFPTKLSVHVSERIIIFCLYL